MGGLITGEGEHQPYPDEPRILTKVLSLGNVNTIWPHIPEKKKGSSRASLQGAGTGVDKEGCFLPALGEAIERYCASVYSKDQFLWATAEELGKDALDLNEIPRCSQKELSHSKCPLTNPSKAGTMRWVQGISLLNGHVIYLPAVMVYLYTGYASSSERIAVPITTGCAAHISYERALLAAILEIIERDALSILWLQKLHVPRLQVDGLPEPWTKIWEAYSASSHGLRHFFFNATMDLEIPTVYAVRISPTNPLATTLVSCASALDPAEAVSKVIRDLTAGAIGFRGQRTVPSQWDDFDEVHHGAVYMADAARASAFDFLFATEESQPLPEVHSPIRAADDPATSLRAVLTLLRKKGLNVYAADLTTDEALRCGMRAVRVIIPGLQPLPYRYRARYLGHPRLYSAPKALGHPVNSEEHINPWPNPFS